MNKYEKCKRHGLVNVDFKKRKAKMCTLCAGEKSFHVGYISCDSDPDTIEGREKILELLTTRHGVFAESSNIISMKTYKDQREVKVYDGSVGMDSTFKICAVLSMFTFGLLLFGYILYSYI